MKQYYTEGCLATSLCYLLDLEHTKDLERDLLLRGMERDKVFLLEHVEYAAEKSGKNVTIIIDNNKEFANKLKKMNGNGKVEVEYGKINRDFIDKNLPAIVLVDFKFFGNDTHYPHYIVIKEKMDSNYKVLEPFSGNETYVDENHVLNAISSVKNRLDYAPVLIKM